MINVDGVIHGNYRCSLAGVDMNRVWKNPSAQIFPEVVAIKKMVKLFHRQNPVILYTDLHGHSRARKAFCYGNNYLHNPESTRLFPYILSKIEPQIFSFEKSRFTVDRVVDGCSRIVMWRLLRIPAVYTLETSLCGASIKSLPHFTCENLK